MLDPNTRILFVSGYDRDHDTCIEMSAGWRLWINRWWWMNLSRTLRQQLN